MAWVTKIKSEKLYAGYEVSLIALILTAFASMACFVYVVNARDSYALAVLGGLMGAGVGMGLVAGAPRITSRLNARAVMWGVIGAVAILPLQAFIHLSVTATQFLDVSGASVVLFAAVAEEWFFRFGLQRLLERFTNPWVALIIQAGVFAVYHWRVYPGYDVTSVAFPMIAGLILGTVNIMTKDISASMTTHFINNLFTVITSW